jgi:hypothetical protein
MQYDFSTTAGGAQQLDVVGSYIKYKEGLGQIRVRTNGGAVVDLTPGQSVRLPTQFTSLSVTDRSGSSNAGILLAGSFEFQDDSIVGVVSVVDGGKAATMADRAFVGSAMSGSVAGQFNMCMLHNPPGSGKNVVVQAVTYCLVSGTQFRMAILSFVPAGGNQLRGQNKHAYGPQSNAIISGETAGASDIYTAVQFFNTKAPLATPYEKRFAEPVVLIPGKTLVAVPGTLAAECWVSFEFREDPL